MSRSEFNKSLLTLSMEPSNATFTTADIANKIALIQSGKPSGVARIRTKPRVGIRPKIDVGIRPKSFEVGIRPKIL